MTGWKGGQSSTLEITLEVAAILKGQLFQQLIPYKLHETTNGYLLEGYFNTYTNSIPQHSKTLNLATRH